MTRIQSPSPHTHATWHVLCVLVIVSSSFAQSPDDSYACETGEDEYGPTYEVQQAPIDRSVILDENGSYILESFIDRTMNRENSEECWVTDQIPAPGTEFTCPQIVEVDLEYTCPDGEAYWTVRRLNLLDRTPPATELHFVGGPDPQTTFGQTEYYVAPVTLIPAITIEDSCDANPDIELLHNDQPFTSGTPISETGLHIIQVLATDESGNLTHMTRLFEIRPRPNYTGVAVVETTNCVINSQGGVESINLSLLLSDETFDHTDILLSSVRMYFRTPDGEWINTPATPIKDAFSEDCNVLQHEAVAAEVNDYYWSLEFEASFDPPLSECPGSLEILGVGHDGSAITFDWGARTENIAHADAQVALMEGIGLGQIDPGEPGPPGPEPPVECEKIDTIIIPPDNICTHTAPAPGCTAQHSAGTAGGSTKAVAGGNYVYGNSSSMSGTANDIANCTVASACGPVANSSIFLIELVGTCCECEITFDVSGGITARGEVSGSGWDVHADVPYDGCTGSASVEGLISFSTPCGSESAIAVVAATDDDSGEVIDAQSASVSCTVNSCAAAMVINTVGQLSTSATAHAPGVFDTATCTATSSLFSNISMNFNASFSPCSPPCDEPYDP